MPAVATQIPTGTWQLDKIHSTAGFAVKHMVVATFRGRFEDFDVTLESGDDGSTSLVGTVKADSIVVKDENLAAHLKTPDFFDVEKVGLELEAIVDRTEYGLTWNAPLPKGGFALSNDVKLGVVLELVQA